MTIARERLLSRVSELTSERNSAVVEQKSATAKHGTDEAGLKAEHEKALIKVRWDAVAAVSARTGELKSERVRARRVSVSTNAKHAVVVARLRAELASLTSAKASVESKLASTTSPWVLIDRSAITPSASAGRMTVAPKIPANRENARKLRILFRVVPSLHPLGTKRLKALQNRDSDCAIRADHALFSVSGQPTAPHRGQHQQP